MKRLGLMAVAAFLALAGLLPCVARAGPFYVQTNLVTDNQALAPARFTDPNLVNPWGISHSGGSPFWVSDNGSGLATLYNTSGPPQGLVVTIPRLWGGQGNPTGNRLSGG